MERTDDAVRETIIGAVLLLLVASAHLHRSVIAFVALAATFAQHVVWVAVHHSLLTDDMVFYGTAVMPVLALYHRCPYIGAAGTYSFMTKVIDHHPDLLRSMLPPSLVASRASWEMSKLGVSLGAFAVVWPLMYCVDGKGFKVGCDPTSHRRAEPQRQDAIGENLH